MINPENIAQGQLDAYNRQDIEDFLSWYADDVEVYVFPGEFQYSGKGEMRKRYLAAWEQHPDQHAELVQRMSNGNIIMDKEFVTGRSNGIDASVIAIYQIEEELIRRVWFVRK